MPGTARALAMFPLGSVLFPGMPLPLRVFEPRYVAMLGAVLGQPEREFGVVLIERGSEVGGGDVRFDVGTVARVDTVQIGDGSIALVATGTVRFEVVRWLQDDPFPRAEVRELDPWEVDAGTASAFEAAETLVRATLTRASEFVDLEWSPDVVLSHEAAERLWQVAAIAPLGAMDQLRLLRSTSPTAMLETLVTETVAAEARLTARWPDDEHDEVDDPG